MEEQNGENSVQFSPLAMNYMAKNGYALSGDHYAYQNCMTQGSHRTHQEPVVVPEWLHSQQTTKNYVEFLAERGYPENQRHTPYNIPTQGPSFGVSYPSQLEEHPHNVENFGKSCAGLELQYGTQDHHWNGSPSHSFQAYSGSGTSALESISKARQKRSREKAYAADRFRRLKISHWLDALKELVPQPEEVGKAALLDKVIDHVKHLQSQVKDLCESRLGGEPILNSLLFLEGHGHYLFQGQMLNGPVEHMVGKLIECYPSVVNELLESRGLVAMPMTFAEELLKPIETFHLQEKDAFSMPRD